METEKLSDEKWYQWKEVCHIVVEDAILNNVNINKTIDTLSKKFKIIPIENETN